MRADSELTWDHSSSSSSSSDGEGGGGGGLANPFSLPLSFPLCILRALLSPRSARFAAAAVAESNRLSASLSLLASGGERRERSGRSYVRAQKRSPARAIAAAAEAKARDGPMEGREEAAAFGSGSS